MTAPTKIAPHEQPAKPQPLRKRPEDVLLLRILRNPSPEVSLRRGFAHVVFLASSPCPRVSAKQGGVEVGLLVRPRQLEHTRAGVLLYAFNRPKSAHHTPEPAQFPHVYEVQAEALSEEWDLIVLAVSTVALGKGSWLQEVAESSRSWAINTSLASSMMRAWRLLRCLLEFNR